MVGQAGLQVEIRANATGTYTGSGWYRGRRITTGTVCNTFSINGGAVGYTQTITCASPITGLSATDDYVSLQAITSSYRWQNNYRNFLMVGELEFS